MTRVHSSLSPLVISHFPPRHSTSLTQMASLHYCSHLSSPPILSPLPSRSFQSPSNSPIPIRSSSSADLRRRRGPLRARTAAPRGSALPRDPSSADESVDRAPFNLNLAVLLAGFAFEAYATPPSDAGTREVDGAGCQTIFLSETKEPTWNENLAMNINRRTAKFLQIAAWDANLVTPHKRMGNAAIDLTSLCDGNLHELVVDLEGIGGGGKLHIEVKYKGFEEMEKEKQWWNIPFLSDLILQSNLGSALNLVLGAESINVRQFVEFAFGQLSSFNLNSKKKVLSSDNPIMKEEVSLDSASVVAGQAQHADGQLFPESSMNVTGNDFLTSSNDNNCVNASDRNADEPQISDGYFWKNLADSINQAVTQKLGFSLPFPELAILDGYNILSKSSTLIQRDAEEEYVQYGLATPETLTSVTSDCDGTIGSSPSNGTDSSPFDIYKTSCEILSQTETILGALMVLTTMFSQQRRDTPLIVENSGFSSLPGNSGIVSDSGDQAAENPEVDSITAKDMRELFSTAESAMEAWAMLATSLGRTSFIKSEFEKICFLDNDSTDTQVAIWRDPVRRILVVAFRGTEQARWKDLRTDLMLVASGLNPERLGGDFKEEVQVHSGFLTAYDSVRNKIMALVNHSVGFFGNDDFEDIERWHVYVTGHSLGGALATLLALELSSSRLARYNVISVSMYNFGSPRVGNKRFAEVYNQKVKDSWRIVNHRDIIPTVPRLMGYCHVAQPIYLAVGDLKYAMMNVELLEDGYKGDIIGEYTPDVLVNEFMKGEKELIEKLLQTEIDLFRSIRDGSALKQHMEDFYYIALLERVKSNYSTSSNSDNGNNEKSLSA